jgi:dTDP-glucose 4,6-dehydratase
MVINFAAESHVDRSILNPEIFMKTNVLGTLVLLDMARKHNGSKSHQVSTDEVYGELPINRKDLLFTENTPIHTSSPYAASKASADLLVLSYFRTYHLPVTISRCSNNYRTYHFPEKIIPLTITRALKNQSIPIYGKSENVIDWLYVEDHCQAIDLILKKGRLGEIYNFGGNSKKTNLEVVKFTLGFLKKPESLITFVSDRPGHDLRYAIDSTKLSRELGWLPKLKFENGMQLTIDWFLKNSKWISDVMSGDYKDFYSINYGTKN